MAIFQFDGDGKLIVGIYTPIAGQYSAIVQDDIYSAWKEWMMVGDNAKYLQAMSTIGGDDLGDGIKLGSYFFLENGWKIKPANSNHRLIINGNLYTRDSTSPFVEPASANVTIELRTSSLSQAVSTDGSIAPRRYLNTGTGDLLIPLNN